MGAIGLRKPILASGTSSPYAFMDNVWLKGEDANPLCSDISGCIRGKPSAPARSIWLDWTLFHADLCLYNASYITQHQYKGGHIACRVATSLCNSSPSPCLPDRKSRLLDILLGLKEHGLTSPRCRAKLGSTWYIWYNVNFNWHTPKLTSLLRCCARWRFDCDGVSTKHRALLQLANKYTDYMG